MAPKNTQTMETEKNKTNGNSGDTTGLSCKKWDLRETWNACIWHGGSIFDAWFNAVAAQVGSVILTLPYTLSQMGYGLGIGFQILYGAFGCWTVYLLSVLYAEASSRSKATGNLHKSHILQYHEVIGIVAGKWFGRITLGFNMVALTFACVLQLIACSSDVYYMNSKWNKREWLYLFGSLAIPSVLLPSIHNFRVVSLLGIATTTLTSIYMTVAATQHGQIDKVTHQGPKSMVQFFSGATNILFSFGSHGLCIELMEAMWKPKNYKYAYVAAVLYTYFLTVPDSVSVYWAYGDILLHNSNAFAVLPKSKMKNVAIIAMILHQYVAFMLNVNPLFLAWEKLLGKHTSGRFAVKAMCRIPVVLVIWFLALAIPFFGPINSVMGAFLISFSVYIIPSVTYMRVYWKKELEEIKYNDAEVKQLLVYTAIEMESIRASAQSQRQAHETLIEHLEELLESAKRERDETIEQCVNLTNQLAAHYSNAESVARTNNIYKFDITHHRSMLSCTNSLNTGDHFKAQENLEFLPERGKFVEAVVRAGPLLQTLLVGCPLPHWRYPPPPSSAIHCSQPQLIGPQTTDSTSLRPPGLRYNDFSCCCIYNSNAGGFFPPFFSNFRPQFSPPWETDRSRQVLQGPLQFIHAGESGFSFKGNALGNVVFNYGTEECPEGETMMSTWTIPEMGSTEVGFQPASNFGSEKMCFTPPTMLWNRTI